MSMALIKEKRDIEERGKKKHGLISKTY